MFKSKQGGFTLIELVVVIVILGILAAFAVPRFMGLEVQARIATVNSMAGSIRSAGTMAYSVWLASGVGGNTVTINGTSYPVAFGYPTRASIDDMIQDLPNTGFGYAPGTGVFSRNGATTPANCSVTYTAPTAANTPPTVAVATGGC